MAGVDNTRHGARRRASRSTARHAAARRRKRPVRTRVTHQSPLPLPKRLPKRVRSSRAAFSPAYRHDAGAPDAHAPPQCWGRARAMAMPRKSAVGWTPSLPGRPAAHHSDQSIRGLVHWHPVATSASASHGWRPLPPPARRAAAVVVSTSGTSPHQTHTVVARGARGMMAKGDERRTARATLAFPHSCRARPWLVPSRGGFPHNLCPTRPRLAYARYAEPWLSPGSRRDGMRVEVPCEAGSHHAQRAVVERRHRLKQLEHKDAAVVRPLP